MAFGFAACRKMSLVRRRDNGGPFMSTRPYGTYCISATPTPTPPRVRLYGIASAWSEIFKHHPSLYTMSQSVRNNRSWHLCRCHYRCKRRGTIFKPATSFSTSKPPGTHRFTNEGLGTVPWTTGVRFPEGAGILSLRHRVQTGSGAHPASCQMANGGNFPGCKTAGPWG
jgi:hypothetical protein